MAGGAPGGLLHGVISWRDEDLERLRLVASAMAGRPVALEAAEEDAPGYTDGRVVYLPAVAGRDGRPPARSADRRGGQPGRPPVVLPGAVGGARPRAAPSG